MQDSSEVTRPKRPVALTSLRGEKEFRKVRAHGVALRDPLFTLRVTEYRPRFGETWRPRAVVGIVVSKKTLKHAVKRNRVRRRVREALRTLPGGLPPCRAILLPSPAVLTVPFLELQAALASALAKAPGRVKSSKSGARNAGQGQGRRGTPEKPRSGAGTVAAQGNLSGPERVLTSMPTTTTQEEM